MATIYNSIFTGSQIDDALQVIRESEITAPQLQVLVGVGAGSGEATKAVILDADRNFEGINKLTLTRLQADNLVLPVLTESPTDNPPTGYMFVYLLNGEITMKDENGTVTQFTTGVKKEFTFTNQTAVVCNHAFGEREPLFNINIGNVEYTARVEYTDVNTLTVKFNSQQTGKIVCRKV